LSRLREDNNLNGLLASIRRCGAAILIMEMQIPKPSNWDVPLNAQPALAVVVTMSLTPTWNWIKSFYFT